MIAWPALERAAQQAGWKRNGRTWRGAPGASCGGGTRDTAWVGPGTTAAFVRGVQRGVQRARDRAGLGAGQRPVACGEAQPTSRRGACRGRGRCLCAGCRLNPRGACVSGPRCRAARPGAWSTCSPGRHAAVALAARVGTLLLWVGEAGVRLYAAGQPGGARADRLLWQCRLALDPNARLKIVRRMFQVRFGEKAPDRRSVDQLRGIEGVRVRIVYQGLAQQFGVHWAEAPLRPVGLGCV